jgi:hypothetical protein
VAFSRRQANQLRDDNDEENRYGCSHITGRTIGADTPRFGDLVGFLSAGL